MTYSIEALGIPLWLSTICLNLNVQATVDCPYL
jgi:hypothetical protein